MTQPTERFASTQWTSALRSRPALTVAIVLLTWVGASIFQPGFGTWGHLRYLLELAAIVGLVSIGQSLVVVAGGIDLSVGAIVTVSAIGVPLVTWLPDPTGAGPALFVLLCATAIGVLNGLGVAFLRVQPMIMTLAMATFLQGVLILIAGGSAISAQNAVLTWLGNARPGGLSASVILWMLVSGVTLWVLHKTPFGARLFALGTNPLATSLSGISVKSTTVAVYAISGFTAGLAGALVLGVNGQGYVGIGDSYLLASIAAVVLGGTSILGGRGTYAGTIPGAILLVTITAVITMLNASAGWRNILFGTLIMALLLLSGRERQRR